jgi:hypothetical protein
MKVLYVASKPDRDTELNLTKEITELQRRFAASSAEPVEFRFLPDVKVEELPGELSNFLPDILHIASHAETDALSLSDQAGNQVKVTAGMLSAFLPPDHPPRLVYLNACDSEQMARALTEAGAVQMAIGSTAPISNRAARASAVAFYEWLLKGFSVRRAHHTCDQMLQAQTSSKAKAELFHTTEITPEREIMHRVPVLVADFENPQAKAGIHGYYKFRLGIFGCPTSTTQVLFFTDDEDLINDYSTMEQDLCLVVRGTPQKGGFLWSPPDAIWEVTGDHRLFAVGVKAGGAVYAIQSTLCEAVESTYRYSASGIVPESVAVAIKTLRANSGDEFNPAVRDKITKSKKVKKKS